MTESDEKLLTERVGILEETVSDLLSYLRERSETTHDHISYNVILQNAITKVGVAEKVLKHE